MTTTRPDAVTPEQVIGERADWRRALAQQYAPTASRLTTAYERMVRGLQPYQNDFTRELTRRLEAGERITPEMVRGLPQYQRLLARIEAEYNDFGVLVRNAAGDVSDQAVPVGAGFAEQAATLTSGNATGLIGSAWLRPSPETLQRVIGYVDSGAFRQAWSQYGTQVASGLADVLLAGVAQGKHPTVLARIAANWYGIPYAWAENATRTAQLWSFRTAAHATYMANSAIVRGWVWWAALDDRTCWSCWGQHGSEHALDEVLNDHHRGRCTPLPIVIGRDQWVNAVETGPTRFGRLSEAEQRAVFRGNQALYDALQAGAVTWPDMSQRYTNPIYGEMLRAASLRGIVGTDGAQEFYTR